MITEEKWVKTFDELKLNCKIHENGSPVWIIVTHGLGEHGDRHSHLNELFSQYFNICTYDLRGHGKSDGKKGYAKHFYEFSEDLHSIITFLKKEYQMKRYILIGHSMGGLVTSSYMQKRVDKDFYPEKVILSSPACAGPGAMGNFFRLAPRTLNNFMAGLPLSIPISGVLDIKKLSHDPRVYEEYIKNPMNVLKIHTHLLFEILRESKDVFSKSLRITCDLYVGIGTEDYLVNAPFCIEYFKNVEKQANLYVVEGGYHELHNEIEKYRLPFFDFLKKAIMDSIYT